VALRRLGLNGWSTAQLSFAEVRVPADRLRYATEIQKLIIARNILGVPAFGDEGPAPQTTGKKGA